MTRSTGNAPSNFAVRFWLGIASRITGAAVGRRIIPALLLLAAALAIPPLAMAQTDTDGDGLFDIDETAIYGTGPTLVDSDVDSLSDGEEVYLGIDPLVPNAAPAAPAPAAPAPELDTDGDGLSDAAEFAAGTDPILADSDGDTLTNGQEYTP